MTRQGSERAFAALVAQNQSKVRNFLRRLSGTLADADDLAQEAFIIAWEKRHFIKDSHSFSSFVCGIAYRIAANAKKSFWRRNQRDQAWYELAQSVELPSHETRMTLEVALKSLPLEQRACVVLCLAENYSHAEAAEVLNLPLGTVKSHVQRARQKLNSMLGFEHD